MCAAVRNVVSADIGIFGATVYWMPFGCPHKTYLNY